MAEDDEQDTTQSDDSDVSSDTEQDEIIELPEGPEVLLERSMGNELRRKVDERREGKKKSDDQ